MNYSRIAPNIKPYTAQQNMASEASQSYPSNLYPQQQQSVTYQASHSSDHQPIYRPAYRRIPYTSFSTSQLPKSSFASMLPEPAPIIVPSQQHFLPFPNLKVSSDQTECTLTDKQSATSGSINSADQIPQLHGDCTFENDLSISSVSYEQTHQKELVKDVFFSPAYMIISDNVRRASSQCDWSSSASLSAQSDDGSEVMTSSIYSDNTQETPSDVLYGEGSNHSIDILGLELISESLLILDQNDDTGKDIACLNSNDKMNRKLAYKQTAFETINYLHGAHDLPTQSNLSSTRGTNKFTQNKRRRSDSAVQQQYINKRSRTKANSVDFTTLTERPHVFSATTSSPFVTPSSSLEHEFNLDSSEYYPTVDSNEAKPSKSAGNSLTVEQSRFGNEISDTAINFQHNQDAFSIKLDEEEHISTADVQEDDLDVNQPYTLTNQNSFSNTQKLEESAKVPPRPTLYPTIYQKLTEANIDWCRYCGTTEGVNWRPGPWGKRTLCNKHGCDYKGYGFACKLPRLDLTEFLREKLNDRERPVLQLYCSVCQCKDSWRGNVLVRCEGCPKAYHQKCSPDMENLTDDFVSSQAAWFCDKACCDNAQRKKIVVELPRKRLPLMSSPTAANLTTKLQELPCHFE